MEQNPGGSALLDLIRSRLPGGTDADLDGLRSFIKDHPLLSVIGMLVGGDSARRLVELLDQQDHHVEVIANAVDELPSLGWAVSSQIPVDAYSELLEERAAGGTVEQLEAALDEVWHDSAMLGALPGRIGVLGAGDDELREIASQRARLVGLAWDHHVNGAYEASVPIVLAQVDGITHDATASADKPQGRSFFSMSPMRQADVADDETLAGIAFGLPAVRTWFSDQYVATGARGTANRHGVMHGRELRYDTRINSTKSFVLLLATWEWASRRLAGEAERRKAARYAAHAGSNKTDENGWRMDRRGFSTTRDRLRRLALAERAFHDAKGEFGSFTDLLLDPVARSLMPEDEVTPIHLGEASWWAVEQSEAGWLFAIGGDENATFYFDGDTAPETCPPGSAWRSSDDGNWSGDCYW